MEERGERQLGPCLSLILQEAFELEGQEQEIKQVHLSQFVERSSIRSG